MNCLLLFWLPTTHCHFVKQKQVPVPIGTRHLEDGLLSGTPDPFGAAASRAAVFFGGDDRYERPSGGRWPGRRGRVSLPGVAPR